MVERILSYIATWESRCYGDGIPDSADASLEKLGKVPSYRRVCMAIMKNDVQLASLGYARPRCAAYMMLKRIELRGRGKVDAQMEMFQ